MSMGLFSTLSWVPLVYVTPAVLNHASDKITVVLWYAPCSFAKTVVALLSLF